MYSKVRKIIYSTLYGTIGEKAKGVKCIKVVKKNSLCGVAQIHKGDWIDLRTAEDTCLAQGEFKYISLGVAMELPKGYEAIMAPRSSTFKHYGVIQFNSIGIIDETYKGDDDIWHFPAFATRNTFIPAGTRICQFRILKHQPLINFIYFKSLGNKNRGGLGSTGKK